MACGVGSWHDSVVSGLLGPQPSINPDDLR